MNCARQARVRPFFWVLAAFWLAACEAPDPVGPTLQTQGPPPSFSHVGRAVWETVTFESIVAEQGTFGAYSTGGAGRAFETEGFRFQMGADAVGLISMGGTQYCSPSCPVNGSNYLFLQDSGNFTALTISRPEGARFGVKSFDAAESFVGLMFEARWLVVTGVRANGGIISKRFRLDRINDGVGPLKDFQTFELPGRFKDLLWFSINGEGGFYDGSDNGFKRNDFAIDNIVVSSK